MEEVVPVHLQQLSAQTKTRATSAASVNCVNDSESSSGSISNKFVQNKSKCGVCDEVSLQDRKLYLAMTPFLYRKIKMEGGK